MPENDILPTIPPFMQHSFIPYGGLRKRKILAMGYNEMHHVCMRHLKQQSAAVANLVRLSALDHLDLAVDNVGCDWNRFLNSIMLDNLPACGGEYLTPLDDFQTEGTMLGSLYVDLSCRFFEMVSVYCFWQDAFLAGVMELAEESILHMKGRSVGYMERAIKGYLKFAELFNVYHNLGDTKKFRQMYQTITSTLATHLPKNTALAIRTVRVLCQPFKWQRRVFLDLKDAHSLEHLLRSAKKEGFDFWGLWPNTGVLAATFNPVAQLAPKRCDLAVMLLKYGFVYDNTLSDMKDRCSRLVKIRFKGRKIITRKGMARLLRCPVKPRLLWLLDVFLAYVDYDTTPWRVMQQREWFLEQLARSVPGPPISAMELSVRMALYLKSSYLKRLCHISQIFAERKLYRPSVVPDEPPSLLHLSRCAVREALRRHNRLPEGVEKAVSHSLYRSLIHMDT